MNYDPDSKAFPAEAYQLDTMPGVAWRILGWHTEPDEDTHWTGIEINTGRVVAKMIGDDRHHSYDPDDFTPLDRADYCGVCGQVGCGHDGYDREAS